MSEYKTVTICMRFFLSSSIFAWFCTFRLLFILVFPEFAWRKKLQFPGRLQRDVKQVLNEKNPERMELRNFLRCRKKSVTYLISFEQRDEGKRTMNGCKRASITENNKRQQAIENHNQQHPVRPCYIEKESNIHTRIYSYSMLNGT